jgi:Ca2+/Na+ antiporter
MKDRKMTRGETVVFVFLFLGMFCLVKFHEKLQEWNLILPVIIVVFVAFLGFFAWQIAKDWKKPDEEILDTTDSQQSNILSGTTKKQPTYEDRQKFFFSSLAFIAFILFREKKLNPGSLIFCGIVLLAGCAWFLPAWIQKRRGKEGQPLFPKAKLQPEQIFYMLFSLAGTCFIIFWIYIVLRKIPQFWWFSIPGFIIGAGVSRPLVAGLRILLRKEKDPGEKHINKRKDADPWDRPDRKL